MTVRELEDRRHTLAREARAIVDMAEAENRDLTPDDRQRFDAVDEQITDLYRRVAAAGYDGDRGSDPAAPFAGLTARPIRDSGPSFLLGRGIESLSQRRRTHDVSEQHRHQLPLLAHAWRAGGMNGGHWRVWVGVAPTDCHAVAIGRRPEAMHGADLRRGTASGFVGGRDASGAPDVP